MVSLERPPESPRWSCTSSTERSDSAPTSGLLRDERVTVVEVAESPGSPYLEDFEVGLDVSAHATALGKALLAALPPRTRRDLLLGARPPSVHGATRETDLDRLEEELRCVRPGAAVVEHGEFRDGSRLRRCPGAANPG